MIKKIGCALLLMGPILLAAASGNAAFELGKSLKYKCFDDPNSYDGGFCLGYITGIADTMKEGNKVNNFKACIPDSATDQDILGVVKQVLKENPGNMHYTGNDLVAFAYQDAYPCK